MIEHISYDHDKTHAAADRTTFLQIDDGASPAVATGNTTLTLNTTDFGGINNISISNITWVADDAYTVTDDYTTQRDRLYGVRDKINDLDDYYVAGAALRDEGAAATATTNRGFLSVLATATATATNLATDIDHTLYQNFQVGGQQVYQDKIDYYLKLFQELDV
jgi:hypothetical protein